MKFLANENFAKASIIYLRNRQFDVTSIAELYPGVSDEKVMEIADTEARTILTHDRDYGELIFKRGLKPQKGVIYFRLSTFEPEEPAILLLDLLKQHAFSDNSLTVIDEHSIRQRKYGK